MKSPPPGVGLSGPRRASEGQDGGLGPQKNAWKGRPEAQINSLSEGGQRAGDCISAVGNDGRKDVTQHHQPLQSQSYCLPYLPRASRDLLPFLQGLLLPLTEPPSCLVEYELWALPYALSPLWASGILPTEYGMGMDLMFLIRLPLLSLKVWV